VYCRDRSALFIKKINTAKNSHNILRRETFPVFSKRNLDILQIPLAKKLILLLQYLAAEHDIPDGGDEMLFEILHFDWFNIPPVEIAKLSTAVADRRFGENKTSLRKLLSEKVNTPPADLFSPCTGRNESRRTCN
jgi:DNA helicase-2/ATP-dependent DNA helicase PcrA